MPHRELQKEKAARADQSKNHTLPFASAFLSQRDLPQKALGTVTQTCCQLRKPIQALLQVETERNHV